MTNRQIDIITATLQALEEKQDENLQRTLPESASSVDYLHNGVGQPRGGRPSPGSVRPTPSGGLAGVSPQAIHHQQQASSTFGSGSLNPPMHLDASHPNPVPWKPSSRYPKKSPLEPGRSTTPRRRQGKGNPFIDKFIEEIADLVGQGATVDDAINLRSSRDTISSSASSTQSAINAIRSSIPSSSALAGKDVDPDSRKAHVMNQLYAIFSQVSGTNITPPKQHPQPPPSSSRGHSGSRSTTPTRRSYNSLKYQAPPPPKPSVHEPLSDRPKFTTNTNYRPSSQYTPKRTSSSNGHLPAPGSLHQQSPSSSFSRSFNSSASGMLNQSILMDNTHMGNLYHIMNIAFLLIEEEREQYVGVIERTKEQGIRGRVVAVHVISGVFKRFQVALLNWSFKLWSKLSREHQAWLAANQARALRSEDNERRLHAAKNAINRMRSGLMMRVFQAWVRLLQIEQKNRQLLESFSKKLLLRLQYKSMEAWKEHMSVRKWLRGIVNRCIGGKNMNLKSAAFRSWKQNVVDAATMDLEDVVSELREKLDDMTVHYASLEREMARLKGSAETQKEMEKSNNLRRTLFRMLSSALGSAFYLWYDNAKRWRAQQAVVTRNVRRWKLLGASRCLNQWVKMTQERQWLRKFVKRMIGGKNFLLMSKAFEHYKRFVEHLKEEGLNMEIHTLIQRCEFLEEKFMKQKLQNSQDALARVKRTIASMQQGSMKSVFGAWSKVHEEEKDKTTKSKRFFAKVLRGLEVRCFKRWVDFASSRVHDRKLIRRVFNHVVMKEVQVAYKTWAEFVIFEKRNEVIIRRIGMKMARGTYSRCFRSWVEALEQGREERKEQERLDGLLRKAGLKMMRMCYVRSFLSWVEYAKSRRRERNLLQKFGLRMKNKTLFSCFNNWSENAKAQRNLKLFCYRVLCRIANGNLHSAWSSWSLLVKTKRMEEEQRQQQLSLLSMAQARERNNTRRAGARFQKQQAESEEERRERLVRIAVSKIFSRALGKSFESWVDYVGRRGKARVLIGKVMRRLLGGKTGAAFRTWYCFVEREKWQKNVLGKFLARMRNSKLYRVLKGWQSAAKESVRYKVVVGRFLKKLRNRKVHMSFNVWTEYRSRRRWLRGMVNKACGGMEMKGKMAAFAKFKQVVRDLKLLASFQGSKEEMEKLKLAMQQAGEGGTRSEEENAKLRVVATLARLFGNMSTRSDAETIRRRSLQYAFLLWSGGGGGFVRKKPQGFGESLAVADVERIDNYMVMFAHAFNNVNQISSLFAVAAVSVAHMVHGARGNLFLIDRKRHELFTVSGTSVKRASVGLGIVGHVARTGESVLADMIVDERFDENVDGLLGFESFTQTEKFVVSGGRNDQRFGVTQYGLLGGVSPLLLAIAVRNCEGVVIGVLTATKMPVNEKSAGVENFGGEDCLVMHLMAQNIAGNIEKIAAKKVLNAATNNIAACENTLKHAIGGRGGGDGGAKVKAKENTGFF